MNLSSGTDDKDDSFPLQQQLLVCTLILLCKNFKCKEVSLGKVSKLQYLLEQLKTYVRATVVLGTSISLVYYYATAKCESQLITNTFNYKFGSYV